MALSRAGLIVGLGLLAIALVLVLSGSPPTLAGTNGTHITNPNVGANAANTEICQGDELLPRGTSLVRLYSGAQTVGPRVNVRILSGSRLLASGSQPGGWTGATVTVPVTPSFDRALPVEVCLQHGLATELEPLGGELTAPDRAATAAGKPLRGRFRIEYLRKGSRSWWSLALSTARRMGLGHAGSGGGLAVLAAAIMASALALASWLVLRGT